MQTSLVVSTGNESVRLALSFFFKMGCFKIRQNGSTTYLIRTCFGTVMFRLLESAVALNAVCSLRQHLNPFSCI